MTGHGKTNRRVKRVRGISKVRLHSTGKKGAKKTCALCKGILHGTPHGKKAAAISKLTKSEKRPTGLFGGILCSHCRSMTIEEAVRVHTGLKPLQEVELSERGFVDQALQHLNRLQQK